MNIFGLVAEEVLEGEETGDGVEVLRGGEERELEDVAADEGGGGEDVCGAAAELGEGAGVGLAGDEGADAGGAVLEEVAAAAGAEVEDADPEGQVAEDELALESVVEGADGRGVGGVGGGGWGGGGVSPATHVSAGLSSAEELGTLCP
jgi:hypothetical protein